MRRRPRWVAHCSVHVPLTKPPQPAADATAAGVPDRKFGSKALEASAKLRKSSIDCLSSASFEAARRGTTEAKGRQLLLNTLNRMWGVVVNLWNHTRRSIAPLSLTGLFLSSRLQIIEV